MSRLRIVSLGPLLLAAACASGGSQAATGSGTAAASSAVTAPRGRADLISATEIAAVAGTAQNALELVQRLRPNMLRTRASTLSSQQSGGMSAEGPASVNVIVFLDNQRLGEVATLASIGYDQVKEIRYVNASDATTMWGTGYSSGVIQVILKR